MLPRPHWLRATGLLLLAVASSGARLPAFGSSARGESVDPVPVIEAGSVGTVVILVPASPGDSSASYRLSLEPGFRPFIAPTGPAARAGEEFVIPVTFSTPRQLPAGLLNVGRVEVQVDGDSRGTYTLRVRVAELRSIALEPEVEVLSIEPDGMTEIPFVLRNVGNVADTVRITVAGADHWEVLASPALVLQPGDSVRGGVRLTAPARATPGERQMLLLTASTRSSEQTAPVNVIVVSSAGWLGDLTHLPSSVFLGHSSNHDWPVFALSGSGQLTGESTLSIEARRGGRNVLDPLLQRQLAGSRFRIALSRPNVLLAAGDVHGLQSTYTGYSRAGHGISADYQPSTETSLRFVAARPIAYMGGNERGHLVQGEAALETRVGRWTLLAGDQRLHTSSARSTGAGIRWNGRSGSHEASVETSLVRVQEAQSPEAMGPAAEMQYQLRSDRLTARARLRMVPDALGLAGGQGDELSASLSARLRQGLHLLGWGYSTEHASPDGQVRGTNAAGNLGVRAEVGPLRLRVGGEMLRRSGSGQVALDIQRDGLYSDLDWTRGDWSLQVGAELGVEENASTPEPYRGVSGGLRWQRGRQWGWLRLQQRQARGSNVSNIQGGGSLDLGAVEFSGGATITFAGETANTSAWAGAEIAAGRHTALHIGSWASPTLESNNWTVSVGVSRKLQLPLPIRRQPALRGSVFDDVNDNGRRDPDEEGVPGVKLDLGYFNTESDGNGDFRFDDSSGDRLSVRSSSLPLGYVLSPRSLLPARGGASVALIRTAAVHLDVFMDRDVDQVRDPAEAAASGIAVALIDSAGRRRTGITNEHGRVTISNLLPGTYSITATVPDPRGDAQETGPLLEVTLEAGSSTAFQLAVPLRTRTIRMGPGMLKMPASSPSTGPTASASPIRACTGGRPPCPPAAAA